MHHNTREELIDSLESFLSGMILGDKDPISKTASYLLDDLQHLIVTEQDVEDFAKKTIAEVSPTGYGLLMICLSKQDPKWRLADKFDFGYSGDGIPMATGNTVEDLRFQVMQNTPEMLKAKEIAELKNRLAKLEA
jgi:hypothetical protein